jgi:hypothetical protein
MSITLDYLKGKRRAEKALGFLTDIGQRLLSCRTVPEAATAITDHLVRLDIDLCRLELRPLRGEPIVAVSRAPGYAEAVRGHETVVPLDHPLAGTGTLTVARVRGEAPEFTPAELILTRDVAARFLTAVIHLDA